MGHLAGLFWPARVPGMAPPEALLGEEGGMWRVTATILSQELTPPLSTALEMEPWTFLVHGGQVSKSASELYSSKGLKYLIVMFRA